MIGKTSFYYPLETYTVKYILGVGLDVVKNIRILDTGPHDTFSEIYMLDTIL